MSVEPGSAPRAALVAAMRALAAAGLNQGAAGNASTRTPRGFLITPTGIRPAELAAEKMVEMNLAGEVLDGSFRPSSEWRFHRDIYRARPEAAAVVHVHSPYATALACLRREIPAFHYMVAVAGGDSIRCAAYATFGTQALSDHAVAALSGRRACLLANHGLIALGASLEDACALAVEVEALAQQFSLSAQLGDPVLLSCEEMRTVLEKFADYGQQD